MIKKQSNSIESVISVAIEFLEKNDFANAEIILLYAQNNYAPNIKIQFLIGFFYESKKNTERALRSYWRALILDPSSTYIKEKIFDLCLEKICIDEEVYKDFSLESGERQTSEIIENIRFDHRVRYKFAADWIIKNKAKPWCLNGIDAFCGNGYGSRMLTDMTGAKVIGVDGSQDAINIAEKYYGNHRTVFGCTTFPFVVNKSIFDFSVSFESLEHVEDSIGLLKSLSESTSGPLFISVPNNLTLPFSLCKHQFAHHTKHFNYEEIKDILFSIGRKKIISERGQIVYTTECGCITGFVQENQMNLFPLSKDAQFFIFAVD